MRNEKIIKHHCKSEKLEQISSKSPTIIRLKAINHLD